MTPTTTALALKLAAPAPRRPPAEPAHVLTSLSIVLPCFNEEANIADAVAEACSAARGACDDYEVLVVDDGSADGTRALAERMAMTDRHVRLVAHESNRGYGAAVRSGLQAARMDWILLTDGDLQFDIAEVADLAPLTREADMVCGFRIARMDPVHRRVNAAAWNRLVRALFHVPVRDVDCAFKLMRRRFVQSLDLTSEGAMVSTELVTKAAIAGARFAEAGVHHRPRIAGKSSGGSPRVIARAFGELARIRHEVHAAEQRGRAQIPSPMSPLGA